MVGGNDRNQFGEYAGQIAGNPNRDNAIHNVGNQVFHNAVQNLGIQNVRNHNRLIVVLGISNPNVNQNRECNVIAARTEGNRNENNVTDFSKGRSRDPESPFGMDLLHPVMDDS
nr:hypothetical protein [Tanacetum cinerariifolium]